LNEVHKEIAFVESPKRIKEILIPHLNFFSMIFLTMFFEMVE
jgi:hypothetical protein